MNHKELGNQGEDEATIFLIGKGYQILERNYRYSRNEIDIIAKDRECIVFVEVKKRRSIKNGYPSEAVNHKKQMSIIKCAEYYLYQQNNMRQDCRFDVIEILERNSQKEINHIENAFGVNG